MDGTPIIDLYGIGIRLGAYLQIAGMLLSCSRPQTHVSTDQDLPMDDRSSTDIVLLSSSITVPLFAGWTVLFASRTISGCEAWLILSLGYAYGTPRFLVIFGRRVERGGIAIACSLVSVVWQQVLYFWLFTSLYRDLPFLGTNNRIWFFGSVNLSGWFHIFMLVASCLDVILLCSVPWIYLRLVLEQFVTWSCPRALNDETVSYENIWIRLMYRTGGNVRICLKNKCFHMGDWILYQIIQTITRDQRGRYSTEHAKLQNIHTARKVM